MNVLFLFVALPELTDTTSLYPSLIHEFKNNGHNVIVSAKGKDNIKKSEIVIENGIRVLRIKNKPFTGVSNALKKAVAYQEYCIKQLHLIKKYFGNEKIDLVISHSLPPEIGYVVSGIKHHFGCEFYLIQTDFTWQDAVAYNMFSKNGLIGLYYRYWEKKMFDLADYILCPSPANQRLIQRLYPYITSDKFLINPWWQGDMHIAHDMNIKRKVGLDGKFVAIYGGSVGKAQGLEHVVNLAEQCKQYTDIVFLILGKGAHLSVIKDLAHSKCLENIVFMEYMPQTDYLQLLASCDLGLVILNEHHATPNFPSKTPTYLSLNIPVLAAIDSVTDYGDFLDKYNVGLWSLAGDTETFRNNLLKFYNSTDFLHLTKNRCQEVYQLLMQPKQAYNAIVAQIKSKCQD